MWHAHTTKTTINRAKTTDDEGAVKGYRNLHVDADGSLLP